MKYYRTTKNLNYRTGPGTKYTKVETLPKGTLIKCVGHKGKWLKIKKNNKYYYCSGSYVREVTDYGKIAGEAALYVANQVVANKSKHVSGKYKFTGPKVNCSVFVSTCLQEAGLLDDNVVVYHTSNTHKKNSIGDCVHNRLKVDHYYWVKTNKKYSQMPDAYKKPGCVYLYESSIAIVGGDKKIYGCHSSGKTYTRMSMIKQTGSRTYEKSHNILVVGIPRIE